MMLRTERGKHYGAVTAKALAVLERLLWGFHNAKDGRCFPSYARIAEAAGCSPSTVCAAIKQLEAAGLMTWVHRLKRVRERCEDLLGSNGWRWRVLRTSNAYEFNELASESEKPRGTTNPDSNSSLETTAPPKKQLSEGLGEGLARIWSGIQRKADAKLV
jgi:hypothetical protein